MSLNLDCSWRIGESSFRYICGLIRDNNFRSLVEFGSGASTARLAAELPKLSIVSIDHDPDFLEQTRRLLAQSAPDAPVELQHRPLKFSFLLGRPFLTYTKPRLPEEIDVVVIDGPPGGTRRGREACLYHCYDRLRVGGLIVLDDVYRQNEQLVLANWLAVYPDSFAWRLWYGGNVLAVLQKRMHRKPARSLFAWEDSYEVFFQQMRLALKARLGLKVRACDSDSGCAAQ